MEYAVSPQLEGSSETVPLCKGRRQIACLAPKREWQAIEIKVVEYFDFFPTADGFCGIKERKEFERGPNTDYLPSLFQVIQETGNEKLAVLIKRQLTSGAPLTNPQLITDLLRRLEHGESIEGRLSPTHYGIEGANFTKQDIERALTAQATTLP